MRNSQVRSKPKKEKKIPIRNVAHLNKRILELSNRFMLRHVYKQIRERLGDRIKTVTIGQIGA